LCIYSIIALFQQYPKQDGKSDGTETTSNINQKLYYHRLGEDQSKDVLVAEFPDHPKWMMYVILIILFYVI
jgi:prolyl oligopeptidase